jgi:teichuronic acid biosynthesis glycosyltransferase TuaC
MIASLPVPISQYPQSLKLVHVLTLTPFYPSRENETQGCFVAEPIAWTERLGVRNTVFAVQPFYRDRATVTANAPTAKWLPFFSLPSGLGLSSSGAFLFAKLLRKLRELHRSSPVDVIHAHGALPCGHAAALLSRELDIPFVITVHGLDAFSTNQVKGIAGKWSHRVSRLIYQSARNVICVSEKVREQVDEGTSNHANTTVVHNGVDAKLFCPAEVVYASNTILSVGNLILVKGHASLLRAFSRVSEQFPQFVLEIIGEGPELSNLRTLAISLNLAGKVHFLGRQSRREVAEAMQRCAIFALPSSYEGLGCAYLEAMAAGKPVIGCKDQGIEDVIRHGVNGWLVRPGNLEEMASALTFLLSNAELRDRIGFTARQTILQNFTFEYQANQLNRIYREPAR